MSGVQLLGGGVVPTGTIISFMGNNAPEGYLKCDGAELNITDYPALANHFETEFGTKNYFGGDGETTFKVPDLQGEFLRCTGTNTHENQGSGVNVGEHQDGTEHIYVGVNSSHYLFANVNTSAGYIMGKNHDKLIGGRTGHSTNSAYTASASATAGYLYTARPTNTSVWYCIKF
jgi:microcystin-dependent protein